MQDQVDIRAVAAGAAPLRRQVSLAEMVQDVRELKELLARETGLLRAMRMAEVKALHDEKLRLVRRLEIQRQLIESDPSLLVRDAAVSAAEFRAMQTELSALLRENYREVVKAREVNHRVAQVIAGALTQHSVRAVGYDKRGIGKAPGEFHGTAAALTFNQMV